MVAQLLLVALVGKNAYGGKPPVTVGELRAHLAELGSEPASEGVEVFTNYESPRGHSISLRAGDGTVLEGVCVRPKNRRGDCIAAVRGNQLFVLMQNTTPGHQENPHRFDGSQDDRLLNLYGLYKYEIRGKSLFGLDKIDSIAVDFRKGKWFGRNADVLNATVDTTVVGGAKAEAPKEGGSTPVGSVTERLKELEALLEQGLVSEEEYQQKRENILDDL